MGHILYKFLSDWLDLDPKKHSQMPPKREHIVSSVHVRYGVSVSEGTEDMQMG